MRIMGHHGIHDTTLCTAPDGKEIPIDVDLALLVPLLWGAGLRTTECCQDDVEMSPGSAFIDFRSMPDAVRFVRQTDRHADDQCVVDIGLHTFSIHLHHGSGVRVLFPVWATRAITEVWLYRGE